MVNNVTTPKFNIYKFLQTFSFSSSSPSFFSFFINSPISIFNYNNLFLIDIYRGIRYNLYDIDYTLVTYKLHRLTLTPVVRNPSFGIADSG